LPGLILKVNEKAQWEKSHLGLFISSETAGRLSRLTLSSCGAVRSSTYARYASGRRPLVFA